MNLKRLWVVFLLLTTLALSTAPKAWTADVKRTPFTKADLADPQNAAQAAKIVSVDNLVFPSAIFGAKPNALDQVEEVVVKMHERLAERGLGIGNMLQHTILVKTGAADPGAVLARFHGTATRIAPSLKTLRSVGIIRCVPSLPGNSSIMLEIIAGTPLAKGADTDGYKRVPFPRGEEEDIMESLAGNQMVLLPGFEAMDYIHNTFPPSIEGQVKAVVDKLETALKHAGLTFSQIVQHNLYLTKGIDTGRVIKAYHEEVNKRDPEAKNFPGVGAVMSVDATGDPGLIMEMDAIATTRKPQEVKCVPFTETQMDICKTATVGDLTFTVDIPGIDFANNLKAAPGLDAQIELSVKHLRNMLKGAGLTAANLVKLRIQVTPGAGDPMKARARFYQVLQREAPEFKAGTAAEAFMVVEAIDVPERLFQIIATAAK